MTGIAEVVSAGVILLDHLDAESSLSSQLALTQAFVATSVPDTGLNHSLSPDISRVALKQDLEWAIRLQRTSLESDLAPRVAW